MCFCSVCSCEPYETISFKIPNVPIDKSEGKFFTHWDDEKLLFTLQLFFVAEKKDSGKDTKSAEL